MEELIKAVFSLGCQAPTGGFAGYPFPGAINCIHEGTCGIKKYLSEYACHHAKPGAGYENGKFGFYPI
jgi:hypothetical protein